MKRDGFLPVAMVFLWASCCLVSAGTVAADDCARARELYGAATRLLNYDDRAAAFREAADLCPSLAEARVNLADAYENLALLAGKDIQGRKVLLEKAAAEYREAIRIAGDSFPACLGLGDTLRVMGFNEEAKDAYRRALRLKPDHPAALGGLKKLESVAVEDRDGFKTADDILKHFGVSPGNDGGMALMGFENRSVAKDRLRFNNILFGEWSAEIKGQETASQLKEIGAALSSPGLSGGRFVIEGHTDDRGDSDRNRKLSQDRAATVKSFLVNNYSIEPHRIETQGFGYSRPRVPNDTAENRGKNRRVEIVFVGRSSDR